MGFFDWTYKIDKEAELTLSEKKVKEAVNDCLNFAKATHEIEWRQTREILKAHAIDLELDFRNVIITCINHYAADLHQEHYPMYPSNRAQKIDLKYLAQDGAKITLLTDHINKLITIRDEALAGVDNHSCSATQDM